MSSAAKKAEPFPRKRLPFPCGIARIRPLIEWHRKPNRLIAQPHLVAKSKSTVAHFAQAAVQSGLVTEAQLEDARRSSGANLEQVSDATVASQLVTRGVITEYQSQQLLAGRSKFNLGNYVITDWIGQGGMGQVFKARHAMMGREVAIKVLPQEKSTPDAITSFTREIRTQAELDHPRLVRAYDAGQDGNTYFLVTEFVPGTDLRRLVRIDGRLNMVQAASIVSQIALGLQHAHSMGLIHRDIKPGNILVTPQGEAKLSDLGLAGFLHEGEQDPRAGKIVGTADYLSPEQIRDPGKVHPSADIYSLGCTLYYAVTAKVPFPGGRTREKVRRHLEEMPWHPRRLNPDITEDFVDVIADMMEKDWTRRIPNATEVVQRLAPWAQDEYELPLSVSQQSNWKAAPLPGIHDTAIEDDDSDVSRGSESSPSQLSEGTFPLSASSEETRVIRRQVPPPVAEDSSPDVRIRTGSSNSIASLSLILAVVVPLAMLVGALLAILIVSWFEISL